MSDNQDAKSTCCSGSTDDLDTDDLGTTCPVMPGTPVDKAAAEAAGLFRDYRGRRYWLCCKGCGPRFDRDPDNYASTV